MKLLLMLAVLSLSLTSVDAVAQDRKLRVAIGDVAGIDWLSVLIALEKVKMRGVDVEVTYFKAEDIANLAVVNGQVDVGLGTPYALIQNISAPIRIFLQAYRIQFFPVANKQHYNSWQDVDGGEILVHSRTSATLALATLMAKQHGITFSEIKYVPGSEIRALALLRGTTNLAYLDAVNTNFVMKKAPGQFHVLPAGAFTASDETLFAHQDFIEANSDIVEILIEEFLKSARRIAVDPFYPIEERRRFGLLPDLPQDLESELLAYFTLGAEGGLFPPNGGGEKAARADIAFFAEAGQIEGNPESLKIEDFWYLDPLNKVLTKLGTVEVRYSAP